jgi:hypothetical protein
VPSIDASQTRLVECQHTAKIFWANDLFVATKPYGQELFSDPLEAVRTLVPGWIESCQRNHMDCIQPSHSKLPTRILDVGGEGDTIYLRDSADAVGPYNILTHCWGPGPTFSTTRVNLTSRYMGFPIEELPATFRDAVQVTRVLGIKYLWIDSLCIIQRDQVDWLAESNKMQDYYKNAYLTIGAATAENSSAGFLHPRTERKVQLSIGRGLCCRLEPHLWPTLAQSVLHKRAWCLQEHILSTRLLQFTQSEIILECQTTLERETGGYPPYLARRDLREVDSMSLTGADLKGVLVPVTFGKLTVEQTFQTWYRTIEEYTNRDLTFPGDRLPAISGLASEFERATGFQNDYGTWRQDIHNGLAWIVRSDLVEDPDEYLRESHREREKLSLNAPTWSWAHKATAVYFLSNSRADHCVERMLRCQIGVSPERERGEIVMKGRACSISVRRRPREEIESFRGSAWAVEGTSKTQIYAVREISAPAGISLPGTTVIGFDDRSVVHGEQAIYTAVELVDIRFGDSNWRPEMRVRHVFLVLNQHKSEAGKWVRIGLGIGYPSEEELEWVKSKDRDEKKPPRIMFDGCEEQEFYVL